MRTSLILLGFLAGCDQLERTPSHFPTRDVGTSDAVALEVGVVGDGGMAAGMGGRWALFVEGRQCLTAIGSVVENIVWNWSLFEVLEEGTAGGDSRLLRQRIRLCSSELSPLVGGLISRVPDDVIDSLREQDASAFLRAEGELTAYLGAEVATYWGMNDFAVDLALPTTGDDARVIDQDADGAPGVTLETTNGLGEVVCEVELIQRTRTRLDGVLTGAGQGSGGAWVRVDQRVLNATNPICRAAGTLSESKNPSRFVMVRVDGAGGAPFDLDLDRDGEVTCQELRSSRAVVEESLAIVRATPDRAACE